MVDELRIWTSKRPFHKGSCHLTTDGAIEELHAFAARIGMKREWFQKHPLASHYDLTPKMRAKAVELGAVEVSAKDQARQRIERRGSTVDALRAARKDGGSHGVEREEKTRAPVSSGQTSQPKAASAAPKLYWYSASDRADAWDLLLLVFGMYLDACASELEWESGIHFALDVSAKRRLTADEVEVIAFARAEHSKWVSRRIRADRMLASAEDLFRSLHRPALSSVEEEDIRRAIAANREGKAA